MAAFSLIGADRIGLLERLVREKIWGKLNPDQHGVA
jgi:hypothetical protein